MFTQFTNKSRIAFILFLVTFLYMSGAHAQKVSFWSTNWVVGISPGMSSYYGDLSHYDLNPIKTLQYQSGPSISFTAGKKLKNFLEVGLVASFGKTSAESDTANLGIAFKNKFKEFGVYSTVSIPYIINPDRNARFDFGMMANYNFMKWKSVSYPIVFSGDEPSIDGNWKTTHHFGAGYYLSYNINPYFTIRLNQTMQLLTTDDFDSFIGPTNTNIDDRLLISEIGLIFRISRLWSASSDFEDIPSFK